MNKYVALLLSTFFLYTISFGQETSISTIATNFLTSLTDSQRTKALYEFGSEERYSWHFVPKQDRKGIQLNDLTGKQRALGFAVLKHCLSDRTYKETEEVIRLENVLQVLEKRTEGSWYRDPGRYSFIFFGAPGKNNAWGWRFEGHHISFSFSSVNNRLLSGTPGFLGANPALVLSGPDKGKQVFKNEVETAFLFIQSLAADQLSKAVVSKTVPADIITGNSRKAVIENQEGITYAALNKQQQRLFLQLLSIYINRYTKKFADDMMHEIEAAGLSNLRLAWMGNTKQTLGDPYYYRLQGPTLLIELDNSQNEANHIHTVMRDLKHDFGGDELLQHYQSGHK